MSALSYSDGTGGLVRSPSFTLKTALAWLGHDCPGICPAEATEWRSDVWYRELSASTSQRNRTLVEVSFTGCPWSASTVGALLRDVNRCVHPDRIQVREREGSLGA